MSPELETPASLVQVPAMDGTSPMLLELEDIQHFLLVRPRALASERHASTRRLPSSSKAE